MRRLETKLGVRLLNRTTRSIALTEDIRREEALTDFRAFAASQPIVYNARQGSMGNPP